MTRIYEKKDHLIRRNSNLTDEQKAEIIELLGRHPSYENKIDWNKSNSLTYEDFLDVLRPLYINELDIRGLIEGEDYDILLDKPEEKLYAIYTYEASKILASNSVGPKIWTPLPSWCGEEEFLDKAHAFGYFDEEHGKMKPGAKWCISMQTSDNYWNNYESSFYFFFWFRNDESLSDSNKKIAIGVDKRNWEVSVIYDGGDKEYKRVFPSYITEAIKDYRIILKEKDKERILKALIFNPTTGRYDYKGSLNSDSLSSFVSEDRNGFTIEFGKVTGEFNCSKLRLISLKGAPQKVGNYFDCSGNQLTSLKGAPKEVGGNFGCYNNRLTSLEGGPQIVGRNFDCNFNQLSSLEGAPQIVGGYFDCSRNQLTSLEGAPKKIGRNFYCYSNQLTSLEGAPQEVGGNFDCTYNPNLHSLEGIGEVKGKIYKDF